jgi:hypothetical protein
MARAWTRAEPSGYRRAEPETELTLPSERSLAHCSSRRRKLRRIFGVRVAHRPHVRSVEGTAAGGAFSPPRDLAGVTASRNGPRRIVTGG